MSMPFDGLWSAHSKQSLDPKYHLFKGKQRALSHELEESTD